MRKNYQSAVVAIPPEEAWDPIQAIRQQHDRQFEHWMPHVNLVYPFLANEEFAAAVPRMTEAFADIVPVQVTLAELKFFLHPSGRATMWFEPEPVQMFKDLQASLLELFPTCDDLTKFPGGFEPHLSVGQADSQESAEDLVLALQEEWKTINFQLEAIHVIKREKADPFQIAHAVPLGKT
ncbi:2'-5' RNA ligase family protein [Acidobacteriota bacterium]